MVSPGCTRYARNGPAAAARGEPVWAVVSVLDTAVLGVAVAAETGAAATAPLTGAAGAAPLMGACVGTAACTVTPATVGCAATGVGTVVGAARGVASCAPATCVAVAWTAVAAGRLAIGVPPSRPSLARTAATSSGTIPISGAIHHHRGSEARRLDRTACARRENGGWYALGTERALFSAERVPGSSVSHLRRGPVHKS